MRGGRDKFSIFQVPFSIYFVLAGLILWMDLGGNTRGLHSFVQKLTTPVEKKLYEAKNHGLDGFRQITQIGKPRENSEELQSRITFLEGEIAELGALKEENERMRYLLGAGLLASWKFQPVRVIWEYADTLSIGEIGEMREIEQKTLVSAEGKGGVYVGRVEKVVGNQAEVYLPSKGGERIPVKVRDKDNGDVRASGILAGRGGRMVIDQVLTGETLKSEDLVVTAGDENRPSELLTGKVGKIFSVAQGAFQQAEVEPAIDYGKLNVVFVIIKF